MTRLVSRVVGVVALALLAVSPLLAQTVTGTMRGTVTDRSGGALPGVTVTIKNVETGLERVDVTGRSLNWPRYSRISLTSGLTVITMVLSLAKCGVTTRRTPIFFSSYPLSRSVPESWECS